MNQNYTCIMGDELVFDSVAHSMLNEHNIAAANAELAQRAVGCRRESEHYIDKESRNNKIISFIGIAISVIFTILSIVWTMDLYWGFFILIVLSGMLFVIMFVALLYVTREQKRNAYIRDSGELYFAQVVKTQPFLFSARLNCACVIDGTPRILSRKINLNTFSALQKKDYIIIAYDKATGKFLPVRLFVNTNNAVQCTLKTLFNREIKILKTKIRNKPIGEVQLFNCLVAALKNYKNIRAHVCHQKYVWYGNPRIKKELCDVLVVLFYKDYLRFSFIQNKFERRKRYDGLSDFHIDCGQHRLLVERPEIVFVKGNVKSDILKNCIYNTATAYSVFYDDCNGEYDMDFASARSVLCKCNNNFNPCVCKDKSNARHMYNSLNYDRSHSKIDYDSLLNLDEIECHLHFGEVVYLRSDGGGADCPPNTGKTIEFMQMINQFELTAEMNELLEEFGLYEQAKNKSLNYNRENNYDNDRRSSDLYGFGAESVLFVDLRDYNMNEAPRLTD